MRTRPFVFAALAGLGAFSLAYGVVLGIGFVLWTSRLLVFPNSGPPRFEPLLAVGAFAGAYVGWRLGRWRGLLGVIAYGLFSFLLTLEYPIQMAMACVGGNPGACRLDLDFVIPQLWLVPGGALGLLLARVSTWTPRLIPVLEAYGVMALSGAFIQIEWRLAQALLFRPDGVYWYEGLEASLQLAVSAAFAIAAALVLAGRSVEPRRDGLILAGSLALLGLSQVIYQLQYPESDPVRIAQRLSGYVIAGLILLLTFQRGERPLREGAR